MQGILEGIRVLDFGRWIAGPYCAHLLASFGADVVRIERPRGEDDRFLMPVTEHGEGRERGRGRGESWNGTTCHQPMPNLVSPKFPQQASQNNTKIIPR